MRSGKRPERCWMRYPHGWSSLSPLNKILAPRACITMFPLQMATSGFANWIKQHGMQIALSIVTYIISSGMSLFGASVQRTNVEIMSLRTSNTPSGITTYTECSAMPTPRQPMLNSHRTMLTNDSMCFDIFPLPWPTFCSPTSSTQCRSACLTASRSALSTSWKRMNAWTSTMQSGYLCLLTMTSHQKINHMRKFLNGMGRRWRKWAGSWLEL